MIIPFGKYKGIHSDKVPANYLIWCIEQDSIEMMYPAFYDYLISIEETLIREVQSAKN